MFGNNNILPFILAVLPALIYGFIIFKHAPKNSIQLSKLWIYTIIGFLSITFINFFVFIFPDFQKPLFKEYVCSAVVDGELFIVFKETIFTTLFLAFFQVAFLEEFSKWVSFKCGDLIRGRNSLRDHPYAIMFYTTMVAAGFAVIENTEYATKALHGNFGKDITVLEVLCVRTFTSVVIHMICGSILGYYIALGAKSDKIYRLKYNLMGLGYASFLHGFYDFTLMSASTSDEKIVIGNISFHTPSTIIVAIGLVIAYLMATDLITRKIKRRIMFKKKYSPPPSHNH